MRILLSILALSFVGVLAQADEVPARWEKVTQKFSFHSFYSYYSCDYVEGRAQQILTDLGAQDINVKCRGGLPDWDINWVTAEYSVLQSADADKATTVGQVRSRGVSFDESCDLNEQMTNRFLKNFEVYTQEKRGFCNYSQGRMRYSVQLLSQ